MTTHALNPQALALAEADSVLSQKGRSFYWARQLLKAEHAARATRLYSVCRYLDDLADEATSPSLAKAALDDVKLAVMRRQANHPVVQDGLLLMEECGIDPLVRKTSPYRSRATLRQSRRLSPSSKPRANQSALAA